MFGFGFRTVAVILVSDVGSKTEKLYSESSAVRDSLERKTMFEYIAQKKEIVPD